MTSERLPGWRLGDFAPHCHHLHWEEVIRASLPAGLDEEGQVVGLPQVRPGEPQLLAGGLLPPLPVRAGRPGPERQVGVVAGRDPGVLHPPLPLSGGPVVLTVAGRGAHTGRPAVPAGSAGGGGEGGRGSGHPPAGGRRQGAPGGHDWHLHWQLTNWDWEERKSEIDKRLTVIRFLL